MFLEVSCNFIMFVCTWTTIPSCRSMLQSHFCRGSSQMDDHTVLYIGVGLAQAHPNYVINNYHQLCIYHYVDVAWISTMSWTLKLQRLQSFHNRLTRSITWQKMNGTDCGWFILRWYSEPCHNEQNYGDHWHYICLACEVNTINNTDYEWRLIKNYMFD